VVGVLSWGWEGEDGRGEENHVSVGGGEMEADGIK